MFVKKFFIVLSSQKRCLHKSFLRALPTTGVVKNSTIRNGILYSDSSDIVIPSSNITDVIFNRIESFRKHKAIECAISGKSYTYEQIRTKSRNFSRFLRKKLNLQHGDVVAIVLTNRPECAVAALGILEAGLTITSINPFFTAVELAKQLLQSSAKVVITQVDTYPTVLSANQLNRRSEIPTILVKDKQSDSIHVSTIDFEEVTNKTIDGFSNTAANPEDIAFMPLSSGTTGLPKSIQLTHGNLVSAIYQQCHPDLEFSEPPSESHQDAIAAILPFFHIFGFSSCMLMSIYRGVNLITQPKFMPDKFVELLRNHKITFLMTTPPLVLFLTSNEEVKSEYLKNLKYTICGAAPLGELDEERFLAKAGKHINIFQGYGMSETSMIALTATKQLQNVKSGGSVGKPIPNTRAKIISIDDPEGKALGLNEFGEVLIKGPQVMIGYRGAPEENSKAFLNGWLRTGDLGYYDERGCIFIKDRLKEVIKVKGYQVAPAELEELIRNFPAVEDAGVIGIPHPIFGEVPKAYVVEKKNTKLDTNELHEYINKNLVKYKRLLGGVEIIDAIPKNPSGKILRRELKQRFLSTSANS